jgi:L-cystine uptake protein TcyP (sodium:dicarboxylate symporter family)
MNWNIGQTNKEVRMQMKWLCNIAIYIHKYYVTTVKCFCMLSIWKKYIKNNSISALKNGFTVLKYDYKKKSSVSLMELNCSNIALVKLSCKV